MGNVTRRQVLAAVLSSAALYAIGLPVVRGAETAAPADWIELHNTHTGERLHVTFRDANGGFVLAALEQLEKICGDHRSQQHHAMDPQLYVLLVDLAAAAGVDPVYEIISAYRSSETNEKLRSNG